MYRVRTYYAFITNIISLRAEKFRHFDIFI